MIDRDLVIDFLINENARWYFSSDTLQLTTQFYKRFPYNCNGNIILNCGSKVNWYESYANSFVFTIGFEDSLKNVISELKLFNKISNLNQMIKLAQLINELPLEFI